MLSGIDSLIGSTHADTLRGSVGANVLTGGDGNDVLEGRGGSDTSAVAIAAGLMARRTGGPMHQANRRGLLLLRRDLRLWADENAALWSPAALVETLAADGRLFS